jgi:hypothetical protein
MCPFLIETDENDTRGTTSLINETINMLSSWLHL